MNIRDLEYLVALAEHRHFRRAADSCHVSQPTLSGQIRKLEDELGVMLLERTSRKVLFTQAGLLLVDQARTVLREVKVLKEMASQQGETMSGPLHIGLIPTVGPYLLPHIIPMLHQTFPKLEMYLHEAQPISCWRSSIAVSSTVRSSRWSKRVKPLSKCRCSMSR